jgi:hypothetical protein
MAYRRKDYDFNARLCAIHDRQKAQQTLADAKPRLSRIAATFAACIRTLKGLHATR